MDNKEEFLAYCIHYAYGKERAVPLRKESYSRYMRGLKHVEKILGRSIEVVDEKMQLDFMNEILKYSQGTRRVDTQIFQRYIAWGNKNNKFTCDNLIIGKEKIIIGPNTPPTYKNISRREIQIFFNNLTSLHDRVLFGLVYYGGLTSAELAYVTKDNVVKDGMVTLRLSNRDLSFVHLPHVFMREVKEYIETIDGNLFPTITDTLLGRIELNAIYKSATVTANVMIGTSFRDFRTSAIRHYHALSLDLEMTRQFAGAKENKKGWLADLLAPTAYEQNMLSRQRKTYGKKLQS